MAWRGVHISNPARLSKREQQCIVTSNDGEVQLAIEDIAYIILDTQQTTLSGSFLSACVENGIIIIVPDSKHLPAGLLLPFHQHYAQAHIAHLQVNMSQPLKKRLWQQIIITKIQNQAKVLQKIQSEKSEHLFAMSKRINSGDPENIEAQAARLYWSALFKNFIRKDENDRRNGLLNYGYAIVRSALARSATAYGLLPAFGIHHASHSNAFNLIDDVLEPFRPFIDYIAYQRAEKIKAETLTLDDRRYMANILQHNIIIDKNIMTLLSASEICINSLIRAIEHNSAALLQLPSFHFVESDCHEI